MSLPAAKRHFPSAFCKAWVTRIYGADPADSTWVRWRKWAAVPSGCPFLTFDQLCDVSAIATIRAREAAQGYPNHRELNLSEIKVVAATREVQEPIGAVVQYLDANGVVCGRDAAIALQMRGLSISTRSLARVIPKFSLQKTYDVNTLATYLTRRAA